MGPLSPCPGPLTEALDQTAWAGCRAPWDKLTQWEPGLESRRGGLLRANEKLLEQNLPGSNLLWLSSLLAFQKAKKRGWHGFQSACQYICQHVGGCWFRLG